MSLSVKEWNVVYYDISHHKLERSLFNKLSEVKRRGMREYSKSVFVSKLNITPCLPVYQTIYSVYLHLLRRVIRISPSTKQIYKETNIVLLRIFILRQKRNPYFSVYKTMYITKQLLFYSVLSFYVNNEVPISPSPSKYIRSKRQIRILGVQIHANTNQIFYWKTILYLSLLHEEHG